MHKPSSLRDYIISLLIAASLIVFFGAYLAFRRGYFFDAPPTADTLYVFNKVIIGAGTVLLAFTFLIGPIVRYFDRFDSWLSYRKEIGIVGALLAGSHGIISYFLLPLKFPQDKMDLASLPFAAGLLGILLLLFLFILSLKSVIHMMDGSRWWFLQRWGLRLVIAVTLVHVYAMKWESWVRWITRGGGAPTVELAHPMIPGLGMLVMMFVTWVVIVRLYETIFLFQSTGWSTREIGMIEGVKERGRRFFLGSFAMLVLLYIFVFIRFVTL